MKRTLRLFCLFLVLVLTVSIIAGCGRKKGYPPVYTSDKEVVMTLGGYNVTSDFYRYLFMNTKYFFDQGDESYWQQEGNDVEKVKDYVLESLKETYAMFTLADKYKITLTKEEKEAIKAEAEQFKATYSDPEQLKTEMEAAFMTEELYVFWLEVQKLDEKVYQHITAENSNIIVADSKTVASAIETDFVRATHILFTFDTQAESEIQLAKANEVLQKLKDGEDFEKLKEQYGQDPKLVGNTDGYYFTHGVYKNDFETKAFELEIGEISEIITTENGYHIIKRLPIEQKYIDNNYSDILSQYVTWQYYEILEGTKDTLKAEYKKDYKNIDFNTFK